MAETRNIDQRDGRFTVLLVFISCLLLFDLGCQHNWFSFIGENSLTPTNGISTFMKLFSAGRTQNIISKVLTPVNGKKARTLVSTPLRGISTLRQIDFLQKNKESICKVLNSDKQLKVTDSGRMIVEEYFSENRIQQHNSVPVTYTPFFFQPIPINIADKEMLLTVKGVGPALAEIILDYRRQIGPFKSIEDLQTLKGIGRKRVSYFESVFTFNETQWNAK